MNSNKDNIIEKINNGDTFLGIEFGSTRIKAVLILSDGTPVAQGSHTWENRLENNIWTYHMDDIITGLQCCYRSLADNISYTYNTNLTHITALGVSAMMHGYLAFDSNDNLLVPFRTWRNTITKEAADILTEAFDFNIPERWSIAHLYQAVLNHEEHINNISYITTLAGFIHYRLTGKNVLGIGDASGMFPVDSDTHEYDERMINIFNNLPNTAALPDIRTLLPNILVAGDDAGILTKEGALLLDPTGMLQPGCILCPPEGDAGTGMTATNSIRQETGNVSAGTSIFSMVVLKHSLKSLHREIDMVTTPDGSPVAMVHCNNCTSDINAWINIFREFAKGIGLQINDNDLYTFMFTQAGMGEADCGSLMSYNCYSGEPVIGLNHGCPMFIHHADSHFTLANFMRTNIYSALAPLKAGMDILLNDEHIKLNRIMGHGGLFKTPVIGQRMLAAAIDTPVSVMSNAGEGGAWGIAILAAYSSYIKNFTDCQKKNALSLAEYKNALSLADYLDHYIFNSSDISTVEPVPDDVTGFNTFIMNYKKMLPVEKTAVTTNI